MTNLHEMTDDNLDALIGALQYLHTVGIPTREDIRLELVAALKERVARSAAFLGE